MPTTADQFGERLPDGAGATAGGVALIAGVVAAAEPGGVPRRGPVARRLGIAPGLRAGQDAASTVEYALMLLLVSGLCLAMSAMATSLLNAFGWAARALR